jgi:hypothetical protein
MRMATPNVILRPEEWSSLRKASKRYTALQDRDTKTVTVQTILGHLKSDSVLHPLTNWPSLFFSTMSLMRVNL